jgi:hypothetical protein
MSLDKTVSGGLYQSADGSYHDAWGNPVADPFGSATAPQSQGETNSEVESKEEVAQTNDDGTVTITEPDGEIVKLDAPVKKSKKA